MNTAVVTYLYPQGLKYIERFLHTIKQQSFQDFKLIIFNDGIKDVQEFFKSLSLDVEVVDVSGTPTHIRFQSFDYLRQTVIDNIIFQDIDDEMSSNRLEIVLQYLGKYDIVVNDLTLIDDGGDIFKEFIWSNRLGDSFVFDHEFIKDKNIVGIGNAGIRRTLLNATIKYSKYPIVADWFIFYQYMFLTKTKAVFTNRCQTFYRQHELNMAGIRNLDIKRVEYVLDVKEAHYRGLVDICYQFEGFISDLLLLKKNDYVIKDNIKEENLFWWEETKYLTGNS